MYNKSRIFKIAIEYAKTKLFTKWSECLRRSWAREKALVSLAKGEAKFTYVKADHTTRVAVGTLVPEEMTTYPLAILNTNPVLVKYYDLEKDSVRSFRVDRLVIS